MGHSTTTLTIFYPILDHLPSSSGQCGLFTYYLPYVYLIKCELCTDHLPIDSRTRSDWMFPYVLWLLQSSSQCCAVELGQNVFEWERKQVLVSSWGVVTTTAHFYTVHDLNLGFIAVIWHNFITQNIIWCNVVHKMYSSIFKSGIKVAIALLLADCFDLKLLVNNHQ